MGSAWLCSDGGWASRWWHGKWRGGGSIELGLGSDGVEGEIDAVMVKMRLAFEVDELTMVMHEQICGL